jgi:fatty-acid desaturase
MSSNSALLGLSTPPAKPSSDEVSAGDAVNDSVHGAKKPPRKSLRKPPGVLPPRILWIYAIPITLFHVLCLLAFVPYFFSWSAVIVCIIGIHVFGDFGINIAYHRLLAHRSFKTPKWFERFLVLFSLCCMQDTPAKWVATHRKHHRDSDEEEDPHSPLVAFVWGHFGWLMLHNRDTRSVSAYQKFARDILEDPFYLKLEKTYLATWIYFFHAIAFMVIGAAIGYFSGGWWEALRMSYSWLLWGVIIRTVAVWHITWSVNSLTHLLGYRSYETTDQSRNNWFVAAIAAGEGWHNNHHHDQSSASVQHRWYEIDLSYYTILLFKALGLASNVIPPRHIRDKERAARGHSKEQLQARVEA